MHAVQSMTWEQLYTVDCFAANCSVIEH